jgi:chromosome partitioning protein
VDLDPQFNASQYMLGVHGYTKKVITPGTATVWDVFEQLTRTPGGGLPKALNPAAALVNVVTYGSGARVDLLASRLELAFSLKQPAQKETLLAKFLAKIQDKYDLILIDCAPTESLLTTAAYLSSDYILVPVKPEFLSTIGLPLLGRSIQDFGQQYEEKKLEMLGIVFNHTTDYEPEETKSKKEVKAEAALHDWYVFDSEVSYSRSYPKGAREGKPIFSTSYSRWSQASLFFKFSKEFADRIGL